LPSPPPPADHRRPTGTGWVLLGLAAAAALLHVAEDVLMPVALAVLLTFLLAPLVHRLERIGAPRGVAVGLTTLFAFALIAGLAWAVAQQFIGLVEELPQYRYTLIEKLRAAVPSMGADTLERGVETVKQIGDELQRAAKPPTVEAKIDKVQVVPPAPTPMETLRSVLGPLVAPVSTAAIVLIFVVFMLLEREDLRDRVVRLLGARQMHATVTALDDAAQRVSRYLLMQMLINTVQGTLVAAGLWLIGVPDAFLWGALTVVLRFIPYLGPALAAVGPIAVAVAYFPGWTQPLLVMGWIGLLELISNNLLEPRLYGASVGVSSFALIVAAVFWTWLWGVPGLLLSTPLTVCLVVMGKYIPQLGFLTVVLGDQPVLDPHQRFYQRLLANDLDEAQDLLDETLGESTLLEAADTLLLPALRLIEHDHERGAIDSARRNELVERVATLVEDLPDAEGPVDAGTPLRLLCLPAADRADEVAAQLLVRIVAPLGIVAEVPAQTLKGEMLESVREAQPDAVCISAAPPAAVIHARYLCKKVRTVSDAPIVVGLWAARGDLGKASDRLTSVGADHVVGSAQAAVEELQHRLHALRQMQGAEAPADAPA
jgi:predicted PurR-regulated permease PerM